MRKTILTYLVMLFTMSNTLAQTVIDAAKISPTTSSITIYKGESVSFKASATSSYGLHLLEWYIGNDVISGAGKLYGSAEYDYYEESSYTRTFNKLGTYTISFYCYNKSESVSMKEDFVWWQVKVEEPPCPD
jgi:hypothetical protein